MATTSAETAKAWRESRIKARRCIGPDCGVPVSGKRQRCDACRALAVQQHREYIQEQRKAALAECEKERVVPVPGTRPCIQCEQPFESWDRRRNQICPVCTRLMLYLDQPSYG